MAQSPGPRDAAGDEWPGPQKVPDDEVTPELLALWFVRNELRLAVVAQDRAAEALEQARQDVTRLRAKAQLAETAAKQAAQARAAAGAHKAVKAAELVEATDLAEAFELAEVAELAEVNGVS